MADRAHCKAAVVDKCSRYTGAAAVQLPIPNTYIDYRYLINDRV